MSKKKVDFDYLNFFAETALTFTQNSYELNIYQYIAKCLHLINPHAYIIVNAVDPHEEKLITKSVMGLGRKLKKIISLLGFNLIGKSYKYDEAFLQLKERKLVRIPYGIHEISFGKIPQKICNKIEKLLKIDKIYGLGFVLKDKIFANAILVFPKKYDVTHVEFLETFSKQASIALKKHLAEQELIDKDRKYHNIIQNMTAGFAFHKIILDENEKPVDYKFLEVNPAFEKLTGLKREDTIGKRVTELIPGILEDVTDWIDIYGKVATTGEAITFKARSVPLQKWYKVKAYSPMPEHFATIFEDISKEVIFEHNLQESELMYRKLFEASKDAIMMLEPPEWNFTKFNQAVYDIFGIDEEKEITSLHPWEISPPTQPDGIASDIKAKKMIQKAMDKGSNLFDWMHKRLDGENFAARVLLTRIDLKDKSFLQASVRDISPQKQAELALEKEKEYYSSFINSMTDWVWEMDTKGIHTFSNPAVKNILGYDPEEVIGKHTTEFWLEKDRTDEAQLEKLDKSLASGKGWNRVEGAFKHKNGSRIYLESTAIPIFDNEGILRGYRGIDRDITDRKQAQKALMLSEEKFRKMFENNILPIMQMSLEYKIKSVNKAFCDLLGYAEKEIVDMPLKNILSDNYKNLIKKHELLKQGKIESLKKEIHLEHRNGNQIIAVINTSLIHNEQEQPVYFLENILDITKRKQAEARILQRENFLTALNKAKELLLSNQGNEVFQDFVEILGPVTDASRTYIFLNSSNEKGELFMSQYAEYCKQGITPQIDNPVLQNLKYKDFSTRWERVLSKGKTIEGKVSDFPVTEQEILAPQNIKTILIIPIILEEDFVGFIGFDECKIERDWTQVEKNFLNAAANDLAQFIKRNRYEITLKNDFKRFESIVNSIEAIAYVTDIHSYEILFANKFLKDLFGFDPVGKICWQVFHEEQSGPCDYCTNEKLLDKHGNPAGPYHWEIRNEKFGKWYRVTDQAIEWVDGRIVKIEIALDITELKNSLAKLDEHQAKLNKIVEERTSELEEKNEYLNKSRVALTSLLEDVDSSREDLEKAIKELNYANENLESFAYSISHDLKAPLRHINGFSTILQDGLNKPEIDKKYYLDKIVASALRMQNMIDDLLLFSRVGRRELNLMNIDMNIIFQKIIEDQKSSDHKRKIKWKIADLPTVKGDPGLLRMVLENLVSNALKFSANEKVTKIEIGYKKLKDNFAEFYIKDNGVGFEMEYADKLFKVFQRLHPRSEFPGSGIGLANVKRIIERLGGNIRAESTPGEGATFYFSLKMVN